MPRETAAERKARIRARLAEDQKPSHPILAPPPKPEETTSNAVDSVSDETEETVEREPRKIPAPSSGAIARRAVERRRSKPTNYKIHVVTALALTLTIRILALGPKAAIGGK